MPDEEKQEVTPEQTDSWDKGRQEVDQLKANVTKLSADKAEVASQLTAMAERSQQMQDTVEQLQQQLSTAQVAQTQSESLDSDMYDEKLIQKISKLESAIDNANKSAAESNAKIKELDDAKTQFETNAANDREETRKAARKEQILGDLDKDYGAKFRNEALKLAQEEVNQTGNAPDGDLAVHKLLEKHYKALSAKPGTTKSFSPVQVDTGDGGVAFSEDEIQEGSRDEVMAQIRAKYKDKPFSMPKT